VKRKGPGIRGRSSERGREKKKRTGTKKEQRSINEGNVSKKKKNRRGLKKTKSDIKNLKKRAPSTSERKKNLNDSRRIRRKKLAPESGTSENINPGERACMGGNSGDTVRKPGKDIPKKKKGTSGEKLNRANR